jgi:hypothetical protein
MKKLMTEWRQYLKEEVNLDPSEIEEMAKRAEAIGDDPITRAMMAGLESDPEISAKIDQIVDELSGKEAIEEAFSKDPMATSSRGEFTGGADKSGGLAFAGMLASPAVLALLASNPTFASLLSGLPSAIGAGGIAMGGALILGLIAAKMAQKKGLKEEVQKALKEAEPRKTCKKKCTEECIKKCKDRKDPVGAALDQLGVKG